MPGLFWIPLVDYVDFNLGHRSIEANCHRPVTSGKPIRKSIAGSNHTILITITSAIDTLESLMGNVMLLTKYNLSWGFDTSD
jgi:hypothetical protein